MINGLPGRYIEDAPFTGLIESLSKIAAVAAVVGESPASFDEGLLANMIVQVGELATEAVVFAGASQEEAVASFQSVLAGLSFGPSDQ